MSCPGDPACCKFYLAGGKSRHSLCVQAMLPICAAPACCLPQEVDGVTVEDGDDEVETLESADSKLCIH